MPTKYHVGKACAETVAPLAFVAAVFAFAVTKDADSRTTRRANAIVGFVLFVSVVHRVAHFGRSAKMRTLLLFVAGWLSLSDLVGAPLAEPRLQGVWVIDVAKTETYLREHSVMKGKALERMRPILAGLKLRYDGTRGCKIDATGKTEDCMDILITTVMATKTVFTSRGADGELVTSTLTWEDDGYWQETSVFPRYREKFVRPQKPNQASQRNAITRPFSVFESHSSRG